MARYLTTKGLFLTSIGKHRYVLEDVFCTCTIPFKAENIVQAAVVANSVAGVKILCPINELEPNAMPYSFRWKELETWYVVGITDQFIDWQVGSTKIQEYYLIQKILPIAYFDIGYGEGERETLEIIDKSARTAVETSKVPYSKACLEIWLSHMQLRRICSEIMLLIHRAINAYLDLLNIQRQTIVEERWAMLSLNVPEIVHTGPKSYHASSTITSCVISLCTSLDISSKLIYFLNGCSRPITRFKNSQGKHFSELGKIKPSALPPELVRQLICHGQGEKQFNSLIQFRHDLVHSTAGLEMEKIYVGFQTDAVANLPLYYSFMPWRDCLENGQPVRYLGRDYFTSNRIDIEEQLNDWICAVINYHLFVGESLKQFLEVKTLDKTDVDLLQHFKL